MKKRKLSTLIAANLLSATILAHAGEYVKGTVEKIDAAAGKITIAHEEIKHLDMPAMTMIFRTGSDEILNGLKEGDQIRFQVERINGKLTVTAIR